MTSTLEFRGVVHQNLHLAPGVREVHAVITLDAQVTPVALVPGAAEVLIVDCSRSMGTPAEKIIKATEAACAAIDELCDGVWFALIAGSDQARMLWPAQPHLVLADPWTRAEAKDALRRMGTGGGAAIGACLRLAGRLFGRHPGAIRHAILLSDGRNEGEPPEALRAALRDCAGTFRCDCAAVGTDWSVTELRAVSSALHGTVDLVEDPAGLAADFRAIAGESMRAAIGEVSLRLWTPVGAAVRFLKQTAPTLVDLSGHRVESGELTGDYSTGSWGIESRVYHLCVELEPGEVGEEKLACRVSIVRSGAEATEQPQVFSHTEPDGTTSQYGSARVRALWTDDQSADPDTGTFRNRMRSAQATGLDIESTSTTPLVHG